MSPQRSQLIDDIRARSADMSAAKRAVGEFLAQNWKYAAFLNAARLAAEAGVSESVVVRFAKDLGYRGYPDLQDRIRDLVMEDMGILDLYRETTEDRASSIDLRIHHSLEADQTNLARSLEGMSAVAAEEAARLLIDAREVVVLGSRTSRAPAAVAALYLNAVLANTRHLENANSDIYDQLRRLDERDVVVAFILRHYNRDTVAQVAYARSRGARVITVTDSPQSPLVPNSDHVFYAHVESPSFYLSQVGVLGIVNALLLLVATLGDDDRQGRNLAELEEIYDTFYYSKPLRRPAPSDEKPVL
jgi:Transcriptional regulators